MLVACSGGADSMLLLNFLLAVRNRYNITVEVAHVEHGIRGTDSLKDAEFVKSFCDANSINIHMLSLNAPYEASKHGLGVEEYSRKKRYEFFNSIPCDKIATAHNLNDNAETALFRLVRGTGLKGMCAISPVRGKIIRPLIEISSDDIRCCCDKLKISYRTDSTNADNTYSRNYIRNNIIPSLDKVNCDAVFNINNFISCAAEDNSFIEDAAKTQYSAVLGDKGLNIQKLKQLHIALAKRIIIKYFSEYNISLDSRHLSDVVRLLDKNSKVQLKGSIFAVSSNNFLRIADLSNIGNQFIFVTDILKKSEFKSKNVDFYCDYDKINGSVKVRSRMSGDTIRPLNRGCSKSLKKLFNELKIPIEQRCAIGVVADDKGVIGVIGYCVDERAAVTQQTQNILIIKLLSED